MYVDPPRISAVANECVKAHHDYLQYKLRWVSKALVVCKKQTIICITQIG